MHELAIPQTYVSGASDNDSRLRVIAVQPEGSAEAALQALVTAEPGCALGLASLARAQPELAVALYRLIDELDGLACRHPEQGLLPLASEPLATTCPRSGPMPMTTVRPIWTRWRNGSPGSATTPNAGGAGSASPPTAATGSWVTHGRCGPSSPRRPPVGSPGSRIPLW